MSVKKATDLSNLKKSAKGQSAKVEVPGVRAPRRRITANPLKPGKPVSPK